MKQTHSIDSLRTLAIALCLAALGVTAASADDDSGYGFYRTVEGIARLTTLDEAEPIEIEPNYPVLTGDRVWVTPGARLEIVLPDQTVLRAEGGTDLYFESIARSADGGDADPTVLRLLAGEIQAVLVPASLVIDTPRFELWNSTVHLLEPGVYRIASEEDGASSVLVREGYAEVTTEAGSSIVRQGEEAYLSRPGARVAIASAGRLSGLELWGSELDGFARVAEVDGYVDPELAYAAAPLATNGEWVWVEDRRAWRPRVRNDWRPYTDGWWIYTPSGLTWVAAEPWGWVTSHYGSWNWTSYHGWVWHPGSVYSPAWVYWYWGPTHTAWVPAGYYTNYYGPRYGSYGFHYGVYGWAGGDWGLWSNWTFCPVRYFGRRNYRAYWRSGDELGRYDRQRAVPRGVITTDTRSLTPGRWGKPTDTVEALREIKRRNTGRLELPDVTPFVARRDNLSTELRETVLRKRDLSIAEASPGTGAARRDRGSAVAAPWRTERPMTDLKVDRGPVFDRDPAVSRGFKTTPSEYAAPRGGEAEPEWRRLPTAKDSRFARPQDPRAGIPGERPTAERPTGERKTVDRPFIERPDAGRPGTGGPTFERPTSERPTFERPSVDRGTPGGLPTSPRTVPGSPGAGKALPPSGRTGPPSTGAYSSPSVTPSDRTPVVRRILEGLRGQESAKPSSPPVTRSGGEPSPTERRPTVSKPTESRPPASEPPARSKPSTSSKSSTPSRPSARPSSPSRSRSSGSVKSAPPRRSAPSRGSKRPAPKKRPD